MNENITWIVDTSYGLIAFIFPPILILAAGTACVILFRNRPVWKAILITLLICILVPITFIGIDFLLFLLKAHYKIRGEGEGLALLWSYHIYIIIPMAFAVVIISTIIRMIFRTPSEPSGNPAPPFS